ncbi:hypothetical protein CLAFUW4_14432 [Fulvia fulva]|uniref:Aldehyde reductase AdhA n=1 Tax=Passalora fulva TaxID=5499 RepID=A0A9Q8UWN6_PASFU|nr:Aldehyde reductase AdhA [Fulvia fulva]UJO25180.1 Aldehyde reductase AdhA [Fulvia fulva]WPV22707.1 hypothetical protein CLAFUW4_14432 [Fulvia fulva]
MEKEHTVTSFHYNHNSKQFTQKSTTRNLNHNDILIKTTHSGICYTDVHAKQMNKGICLGHEGVGTITATGPAVTHLKTGDRVGWGWLRQSCSHCTTCTQGYRQYCAAARGFAFCDEDQGAFGDWHVIDAEFAYLIPESIESKFAAPLMCAGASVFEALDAAGTKPRLGHLAVMFARAMGCGVTALTGSKGRKRDDAERLGADEVLDLSALPSSPAGEIDVLLVTSNAVPSLESLLPLLARRATIVLMTIQQDSLEIPYMPFILPGHQLIASTEASRENHIKMLDFASRHGIKPWVEEFEMTAEGLSEAFARLEDGKVRYRAVAVRAEYIE